MSNLGSLVKLQVVNDSKPDGSTIFDDQSMQNLPITRTGVSYTTAQAPTGLKSSLVSVNNNQFISTPNHASLDFSSMGPFTLEGWSRFSTTASFRNVFSKRSSAAGFGSILVGRSAGFLAFWASSDLATWDIANASVIGVVAINTWYSWAVTYDGARYRKFLNGVKNAGDIVSATKLSNDASPVRIGGEVSSQNGTGWTAPVRLTRGRCLYTGNYTPPFLPLDIPTDEDTLLWARKKREQDDEELLILTPAAIAAIEELERVGREG